MKITQRLVYIGANAILAYCRARTSILNTLTTEFKQKPIHSNHTLSPQEYSNKLTSNLPFEIPGKEQKVPSSLPLKKRKVLKALPPQKAQQPD